MPRDGTRLALFIDGANLYATAKTLGFHIDYKEFQSRGNLVRAFYYTVIVEDQEFSSVRPLLDWSSAPVTLSPVIFKGAQPGDLPKLGGSSMPVAFAVFRLTMNG